MKCDVHSYWQQPRFEIAQAARVKSGEGVLDVRNARSHGQRVGAVLVDDCSELLDSSVSTLRAITLCALGSVVDDLGSNLAAQTALPAAWTSATASSVAIAAAGMPGSPGTRRKFWWSIFRHDAPVRAAGGDEGKTEARGKSRMGKFSRNPSK